MGHPGVAAGVVNLTAVAQIQSTSRSISCPPLRTQAAHLSMLRKDLSLLDLELVELQLKVKMGEAYSGSQVQVGHVCTHGRHIGVS